MPITREEQVKCCVCCLHRKIALNGEVLCGLTDAKADFDPTCPSYEYDPAEDRRRGSHNMRTWEIIGLILTFIQVLGFIISLII
jgi:hypothetical protein